MEKTEKAEKKRACARVCNFCGDPVVFMFLEPKTDKLRSWLKSNIGFSSYAICERCHKDWADNVVKRSSAYATKEPKLVRKPVVKKPTKQQITREKKK